MTKQEWRKLDKLIEKGSKEDKDYRCEVCGRTKEEGWQIHHHHFIGRTKTALRWVNENIFVLCARCHSQWEEDPQMSVTLAKDMRGNPWYKEIEAIKEKICKKTFEENRGLMFKSLKEVKASYDN